MQKIINELIEYISECNVAQDSDPEEYLRNNWDLDALVSDITNRGCESINDLDADTFIGLLEKHDKVSS